jgi:hypothetical protein
LSGGALPRNALSQLRALDAELLDQPIEFLHEGLKLR